jgi:hypothetical protein
LCAKAKHVAVAHYRNAARPRAQLVVYARELFMAAASLTYAFAVHCM